MHLQRECITKPGPSKWRRGQKVDGRIKSLQPPTRRAVHVDSRRKGARLTVKKVEDFVESRVAKGF